MEMQAKKTILRSVIISLSVIALFFVSSFLIACSSSVGISFTVDAITLFIGDSRDIFPYIKFDPAVTDDKSVSLSSDSDCVEIHGTTVRAVNAGCATVTASSNGDSISIEITCVYRPAGRIFVSADKRIQNAERIADIDSVVFTAELDDYVDPNVQIEWKVNGVIYAATDPIFTFSPPTFGEFTVTATLGEVSATEVIAVYRETDAYIEARGNLIQRESYSSVILTAHEDIDTRNPNSVYEWTVNGSAASSSMVYEFIPTSEGEYSIGLSVNGVARKFGESNYVVVSVSGKRAPVGRVVYDDVVGVTVEWSDKQNITSLSITSPDGSRKSYNRADITHAYRFNAGYFDADGLIEVCAAQPSTYSLRLFADGQGDEFTFTQFPLEVKRYLDTKVLCHNNFLDEASDVDIWIRELYACGERSGTAYIFGMENNVVSEAISQTASQLGLNVNVGYDGSLVNVEIGEYINSPTVPVAAELRYTYSELPHIEYDRTNLRNKNTYKIEIERRAQTVAVHNTEQLLLAALSGYRPIFEQGSSVEKSYAQAKDILLSIIGSGYDDFQKIHAIYDWTQWLTRRTDGDRTKTCNYIEAYFSGTTVLPDGYTHGAASSEGVAKTVALLCAMEGISCDIIVVVGSGGDMHYYNSVYVDGAYYNVDVYDGKWSFDGAEICTHSMLLVSDDTASNGERSAFDRSKTYYTQKDFFGSTYYDRYITAEETDYAAIKAIIFGAFEVSAPGESSIPLIGLTVTVAVSTFGAEIMLDDAVINDEDALQTVLENIEKAVKDFLLVKGATQDRMNYRIRMAGNTLHVTASQPVAIATE